MAWAVKRGEAHYGAPPKPVKRPSAAIERGKGSKAAKSFWAEVAG